MFKPIISFLKDIKEHLKMMIDPINLKKSDTVVVFVHGIIEGPNQFEDFIEKAKDKVDTVNLLLPGHGATGKDFAKSSLKEWKQHVFKTVEGLEENYKHIILVGHSRGTLLAIECAMHYPQSIKALFLLAIPLCIRLKYQGMINSLKVALDLVKAEDTLAVAAKKACSIERQPLLYYVTWLPRYVELFRIAYTTRQLVSQLKLPIFIFQSEQDEFVSMRSLKYFKGMKNVQIATLKESGHFYYVEEERTDILKHFQALLDKEREENKYENRTRNV